MQTFSFAARRNSLADNFKNFAKILAKGFKLFLDFKNTFFAEHLLMTASVFGVCLSEIYATRGRSRTAATTKTKLFVTIINGCR